MSGQETEDSLLNKARELKDAEIYLDSVRAYRAYLVDNSENTAARIEFADLLLFLDEYLEAADQVIPVMRIDPDNEEARRIFDQSLDQIVSNLDPANLRGQLQIARLHRFSGDKEQAKTYYESYTESVPDDAIALHEMAQMFYDEGNTETGLTRLQEAILVAEGDDLRQELLLKRATWLSYDAEQVEAAPFFQRFLEETPDEAEVRLEAAESYSQLGDVQSAIPTLIYLTWI